ncbi:Cellulase (glycosyl hydrolase family 5 protein) [Ceratobasidium sp. AG-Ba]|nr:Cellulase (glycosyl hydrolase family 5 protein) [Ceratobasidium sp. AG-Ba]
MIVDSKTLIALLAVLPAALGELEPHAVRNRRRHHARAPLNLDVNISIDLGPSGASEATEQPGQFRFPYGHTKVRGVNLGGWLVLEPWITPSLFDNTGNDKIIDEYTFGQYQDKNAAKAALEEHWSTWITEDDLAAIAAAGLNHVRIPIGFWAFDVSGGEPYIQGQFPYLCKAVEWASKHGVKVLIDLHGAPGSQNGFDNSGRAGETNWHRDPKNVQRTEAVIDLLSKEFSKAKYAGCVTSIAPLNEPAGFREQKVLDVTRQYWTDSYNLIRYPGGPYGKEGNLVEVIHDAFQPLSYWNNFLTKPNATGVVMDTHHYEVFSVAENARTFDQHIKSICDFGTNNLAPYNKNQNPVVTGEWSLALTDCAKYLNGRGIGARYDGTYPGTTKIGDCSTMTGSGENFSDSYRVYLRKFWEAQAGVYENSGSGWIFWTWKNEGADEWSYQNGLKYGWIPSDPTERQYPNQC